MKVFSLFLQICGELVILHGLHSLLHDGQLIDGDGLLDIRWVVGIGVLKLGVPREKFTHQKSLPLILGRVLIPWIRYGFLSHCCLAIKVVR